VCCCMHWSLMYREGGLWLFHAVAICHYCPEWMLEPRKDGVPVCISVTLGALTHSRVRPKGPTFLPGLFFTLSGPHDRVRACVRAVPGA
jgi:hypothetical protein